MIHPCRRPFAMLFKEKTCAAGLGDVVVLGVDGFDASVVWSAGDIANGVFVAYAPYENPEIAVAIAFLGWNLRQLVEYAELIGLPIGELFLEDALEEPWPEFRSKADPIRVENLTRLLGGLGVGLRDDVFGVIRHLQARVTFSQGNGPIGAD